QHRKKSISKINSIAILKGFLKITFGFAFIFWIVCGAYFIYADKHTYDTKIFKRIDDIEYINSTLKDTKKQGYLSFNCNLKLNSKSFNTWEDDSILLTITSKDNACLEKYDSTIVKMLKNNCIQKIIVLKNGNVVFNIKRTMRLIEQDKHTGGFHGDYIHYISKSPINFKESKYSKIKA